MSNLEVPDDTLEAMETTDSKILLRELDIQTIDLDWKSLDIVSRIDKVSSLVKKLSDNILNGKWTERIGDLFPSLIHAILTERCSSQSWNTTSDIIVEISVGLSKLVCRHAPAVRFAETFYTEIGSPLKVYLRQQESLHLCDRSDEPVSKRRKKNKSTSQTAHEFLKSILILMKVLPRHIYSNWDLNSFIQFMDSRNEEIRWLTAHCVGLLLNISDEDLNNLKTKCLITESTNDKLSLEFQIEFERLCSSSGIFVLSHDLDIQLPTDQIMQLSPKNGLVSIGGILVSTTIREDSLITETALMKKQKPTLFVLESTISYLREIALSISTKFKPICLMGSVGVGKSSLLSYSASLFGRNKYPSIISVQMSDQIDSRLLLGSYHSTDLPGQFVWKPGCLTKAVLSGYWIIIEDLDSAPADVLTLLGGLIDTKKLSVPGFGEISRIHPDFRILATCRTQTGKRVNKLGKHWRQLIIQPLTDAEMKLLISNYFPHLKPILERLMCIFQSVGERKGGASGRIVSLRDFLKFCRRIPSTLDFSQTPSAIFIFQEAFDLFAASFPSSENKQEIADSLGTHMGLLKAKTEYFCTQYKPHINICSNPNTLTVGRYTLPMFKDLPNLNREEMGVFSLTRRASCLMEMICGSVKNKEPVLLIGETGVGKTSCVQYLAKILHQRLVVINLNRQSDSGDLLGGYKPIELKFIMSPVREEFEALFIQTFSRDANKKFMYHIMSCFTNRRWYDLVKLMVHVQREALARSSKNRDVSLEIIQRWTALGHKLSRIEVQVKSGEESPFAFSFIEGTLISAIKNGHWILLDEINLATPEMLQCLSGILDEDSDIHLWEKGDERPIQRCANFHLFAAMNPSTDIGKKDLPMGLRNRFTEFYVEELTDATELQVLVSDYLRELCLPASKIESIVEFYLKIRAMSQTSLVDGMGKKPHYSLRTLCRALRISTLNLYGSVNRSLYESFCLSFLTQLDFSSHPVVEALIVRYILGKAEVKSIINQPLPRPSSGRFTQIEGYWIPQGDVEPREPENYILTSSIRRNLKDLARIVSAGKLPILVQGETSVGKTSLIQYLAHATGNNCYRINNHQHTDLQEYAGSYQSDQNGKLVFTEGVLVQAMRRGEWIILDELNLAPSEVMEALNRLLDDNRQLFITETGQTVPAHPRFMLFATQNPPGLYGGRKLLSRAFRNRFVELHFDEIPSVELENILHLRCAIPQSYCKKIIAILRELQVRRKSSAALEGKHGFATLRDLFRWAERYRLSGEQKAKFYDWDQHLADEGYLVLAGKVRKSAERELIRETIQKHLKRTVDPKNLFSLHENTSTVTKPILEQIINSNVPGFQHIVWTFQMRKLAVLVGNALKFKEPLLIVGDTGCGKTSIVQLLTQMFGLTLYSVNCHMHSEGSDFLGGLRPVRNHQAKDERLFEWVNGPLVEAMENGGIFLADEISLADDSVLERVNSVLEPERTLLIAEKGDETPRLVVAHHKFHFIGTMNPGGDYGKKELSPALRNRLTEIWTEVSSDRSDLEAIVEHNLVVEFKTKGISAIMLKFVNWLKNNELGHRCTVSIRDYLSWVEFINLCHRNCKNIISVSASIHHGACLAFLDGLGSGTTSTENVILSQNVKLEALSFLKTLTTQLNSEFETTTSDYTLTNSKHTFGIGPFTIPKNPAMDIQTVSESVFHFEAPTTSQNGLRVLRAMQLNKPILLEGTPGVGKTALVSALAQWCGFSLVRINLSEQTDISDLFGADLPVEGGTGGNFAWRDGPLLQALKNSSWILLDEVNLASQSVLEGLNACLDHRGEIYVPELNRTFKIGNTVGNRVIGCQNPVRQGGARKGLPKSFLNRFTQVFMDPLEIQDLHFVLRSSYPSLPQDSVELMCYFADSLSIAVCQLGLFGAKGSPWDFNLRDLMRWAQLIIAGSDSNSLLQAYIFVDLIYGLRMRSAEDRQKIEQLFLQSVRKCSTESDIESRNVLKCGGSGYHLLNNKFICGNGILMRSSEGGSQSDYHENQFQVFQKQLPALEGLTCCLQMGWMPILVGPCGAGKTSLVKVLSNLTGHKVLTMTVSPEMDTIDLLGGFEQADIYRKIDETSSGLREMIRCLVKRIVCQMGNNLDLMDSQLLDLWSSMQSLPQLAPEGEVVGHEDEMKRLKIHVDFLQTSHLRCKSLLDEIRKRPESQMMMIRYMTEFKIVEEGLERVSKELKHIWTHLKSGIQTGAFQWVDSLLIKAIAKGDWLLIDGANRCSAAVLDRLNSLMEPNGSLFLSERGSIDGQMVQIRPHPNFRLILTLDPAFGEISRAMRNRGVEIFMPGPEEEDMLVIKNDDDGKEFPTVSRVLWSGSQENKNELVSSVESTKPRINLFDLDSILRAEGITDPLLRDTLINLHEQIHQTVASYLGGGDRPTVHHLVESVRSFLLEMKHGVGTRIADAIRNSFMSTYVLGNSQLIDSQLRRSQIESILKNVIFDLGNNFNTPRLTMCVENFLNDQLYRIWKQLDVIMNIFSAKPLTPIYNILINSRDKKLLQELTLTGAFLRIRKEDAQLFVSALSLKTKNLPGQIMNTCAAMAKTLSSLSNTQDDFPLDLQWSPHFLARRKLSSMMLKISLRIHYHLFMMPRHEDWKSGTLGFISQAVSHGTFSGESLKNTQFLSNFSSLVENFDKILLFHLENNGDSPQLDCDTQSEVWRNGMSSFLWRKRLFQLCNQEWNTKENNERLSSNVTLVIMWVGEYVVKFLKEIMECEKKSQGRVITSSSDELRQLVVKCLDNVDHFTGESRETLRKSHLLRELIQHKSFEVTSSDHVEYISATLEICFEVWSLTSFIPAKTFISMLNCVEGVEFHRIITRIVTKILSRDEFTQEDRVEVVKARDELIRLRDLHQNQSSINESEMVELKESLFGIQEYIRVCGSHVGSASTNPLLCAWTRINENSNYLKDYLAWEDKHKFLAMNTTDRKEYSGFNLSSLLPHFVSKIVLEGDGFRIASLGSRILTNYVMTELNNILTKEITRPRRSEKYYVRTLGHKFIEVLERVKSVLSPECEEWIKELGMTESTLTEQIARTGSILVKGGAAMMEVSMFMPMVDPAVEKEILAGYLDSEIIFFEEWIQSQRIHQFVEIGSDLLDSHLSTLHPFISQCAFHLKNCRAELIDAQLGIAFRPNPPNYFAIKQDIAQFVKAFASYDKMQEMVDRVLNVLSNSVAPSFQDIDTVLIPCQIWIDSHLNFVRKVVKEYWYWDVTSSFLFSSIQVSKGLSILCDALYRTRSSSVAKRKENVLQNLLFPIPYNMDTTCPKTFEAQDLNFSNKLFASNLISFTNEMETNEHLNYSIVKRLHDLTSEVNSLWIIQEEEKERKRELEDAMYVYKGQEKAMELSEEDQDALELANAFPNFEHEFREVNSSTSNCLEGSLEQQDRNKNQSSFFNEALTCENITIFLKIQARILRKVKSHWISGLELRKGEDIDLQLPLDFVTPFLNRFEVGSRDIISFKYIPLEDEQKYTPGALIAVHHLNLNYEPTDFFRSTQLYDFYHDPNIDEVQKLNSILFGLRSRVIELLVEWPDHPSLRKIIEVIQRIETFKMNSSLMKFLTGLELLLGFSQDWESCAHQGVSIAIHLTEVTDLIINWRKLELQCWKNLLTITFEKEQVECHKWWFHLYAVVTDATRSESSVHDSSEFLKILVQFIESSPIGQFETRLSFLYRIHCHVISLEQFDQQQGEAGVIPGYLLPYIWNIFCYYRQFREAVATKLAALRSITEKKLKDFVKISRWNDANFYALKDSVQKSQKTLSKLVKEWRRALQTPVATILVADLSSTLSLQEFKKMKNGVFEPLNFTRYLTPAGWQDRCRVRKQLVEMMEVKRFGKFRKFYDKTQCVLKSFISMDSVVYSEEIGKIDDLTGLIIETSHELQNLEVSEQVHEKRKKVLHNIHTRRRTALADLFKVLQESKLSYRAGLIRINATCGKVLRDFSIEPVDIEVGWKHLMELPTNVSTPIVDKADKDLISSWKGCESYFQKCISRISVMMKAFESPSKELGPSINDRCKGFISDLMNLTTEQRKLIANVSKDIWSLKILTSRCCPSKNSTPLKVFKNVHQEACRIEYETKQFVLLIESMTTNTGDYNRTSENLKCILEKTAKVKSLLQDYIDAIYVSIFSFSPVLSARPEGGKTLEISIQLLNEIETIFKNLVDDSILGQSFSNMCLQVQMFLAKRNNDDGIRTSSSKTKLLLSKKISKLLKEILLTFQNLDQLKKLAAVPLQKENDIRPPSLIKLPVPELNYFHTELVTTRTKYILKILEQNKSENFGEIFDGMIPLLRQFAVAGQFYLTILVQFHRATCKLLSVLTGIFATLGSKGFCLPADYEDEAIAEGKEFDAKSGMGLGDGETTSDAKDVSDRMEEENQLEDTLKPGESTEPADKDLDDEDKGVEMSEDFDGKMQDHEKNSGDKDSDKDSDSENEDGEELDKQMGDLDDPNAEKLDEQMWGGSSDEDDEDLNEKEKDKGKGSAQDTVQEMGAKDPSLEDAESDAEEKTPDEKDKESKRKDINEQDDDDTELNDDQTDPYHGQTEPEEEPEPFDLPDDLNLDNAEPNEKETDPENNENSFDLDKCEKMDDIPEQKEPELENEGEDSHLVSDDEENLLDNTKEDLSVDIPDLEAGEQEKGAQDEFQEDLDEKDEENKDVDMEVDIDTVQDNASEDQRKEDKSEPSEETAGLTEDQTSVENKNAKGENQKQQKVQGTKEENSSKQDETACGQAESQDGSGHEGAKVREEQNQIKSQQEKSRKDVSRKPGSTDDNRTVVQDPIEILPSINRLKTIKSPEDKSDENSVNPDEQTQKNADLFQHIKDSQVQDNLTIDNATKEQADQQKPPSKSDKPEDETSENPEMNDEDEAMLPDIDERVNPEILDNVPESVSENLRGKKDKFRQDADIENMEVDVVVEGETVLTLGVQRPNTSVIETRLDLLEEWSREKAAKIAASDLESSESMTLNYTPNYLSSAEESAALVQWHELDSKTIHLAQELCEQLRLILEPTQAARLKGDYKTGKRLNMRKVISYIASGFRKDKIWLRRTQPSKREYQILLALDDSASMADNQSKQMAFSAVAVVARSLGLLEAGQLAVVSFGEDCQLLHPFEEPFTDSSGARLLQKFTFCQRRTRIAQLLKSTSNLFSQAKETRLSSVAPELAQLLLIISDGRGVCHEGNETVKNAIRLVREENIFVVFIIVDNPENKDSILDIRLPIFANNNIVEIAKYMDYFPFPFYLILRDLSALPSVLSDALRQWFELVTSSER